MTTSNDRGIIDMQEMPEYRLLLQLSWPVVLSMLTQGLYSVVDSIYLARLGEEVLSAISLAFVVQNVMTALLSGIATGMNAVISRSLGEGNYERAKGAVVCGCAIQAAFVVLFMAMGAFVAPAYFGWSTTDAAVVAYGVAYLRPCMLLAVTMAAQITFERLLQASGVVRFMLISQVTGAVINIVLDPIMIFGLLGCPAFGIAGAAYATVIGQAVAAGIALLLNCKKNGLLFTSLLKQKRFSWRLTRMISRIGIPTAAMGITSSLGNYCINRLLIQFSATANAAFGVYIKLQSVALMPTQGFTSGLITMFAFFFGKRDQRRIRATLRCGMYYIGGWSLLCAIAFLCFPALMLAPFQPTPQMLEVGIPAFRIIGSTFLLSGYTTVLNAYLQAIGQSVFSLVISLARQVFVRIPAAILLAGLGNIHLIWLSWPISEITSDVVCIIVFVFVYRKVAAAINSGEPPGIVNKQALQGVHIE